MSVLQEKHWFFTLLAGLFISFSLNTNAQTTRPTSEAVSVEKRLIEGKKYALLSDWEKAEAAYKAILEQDVNNAPACYELSRTFLATKRNTEALSFIRKAIRIDPKNEWYLLMEADILEANGDIPGAMDVYEKLITLKPEQPHFYEVLIDHCRKFKDNERLIRVLSDFQKLTGVTETTTRLEFETLDQLGRKEEALASLEELAQVYPGIIEYKFLVATYARKIRNEEKAVSYFREILKMEPDNSRAKLALAGSEKNEQDTVSYLQSIEAVMVNSALAIDLKLEEIMPYLLQFAKTQNPKHGEALYQLSKSLVKAHPKEAKAFALQGDILSMQGNDKDAIISYEEAISLNSGVYLIWEQYLSLLMHQHQYEKVLKEASRAADYFPNQGFLYYAAGYGALNAGQPEEALDWLQQGLMMTAKNEAQKVNVLNQLGLAYDKLGNMDKSTESFESAAALNPRNIETKTLYALTLSRKIIQSKKAIELANEVVKDPRASSELLQQIAEVYYNQKMYADAGQAIQKALGGMLSPKGYKLAGDIYEQLNQPAEAQKFWKLAVDAGLDDAELKKKLDQ